MCFLTLHTQFLSLIHSACREELNLKYFNRQLAESLSTLRNRPKVTNVHQSGVGTGVKHSFAFALAVKLLQDMEMAHKW